MSPGGRPTLQIAAMIVLVAALVYLPVAADGSILGLIATVCGMAGLALLLGCLVYYRWIKHPQGSGPRDK